MTLFLHLFIYLFIHAFTQGFPTLNVYVRAVLDLNRAGKYAKCRLITDYFILCGCIARRTVCGKEVVSAECQCLDKY